MITVGIDEVGRGCWAGPLVAAAVVLPHDFKSTFSPVKIGDSKRLTRRQRMAAAEWIQNNALAIGIGWVWPQEIDASGLSAAVRRAMLDAIRAIPIDYDEIIVDGNINYLSDLPKTRTVIQADAFHPPVSAASIIAKVARDDYMRKIAEKYPDYGFETHVGYGTAKHISALSRLGVTKLHRISVKPIALLLAED